MNDTSIYYLFEQILGSSSVIELTDFFWNINVYRLEYQVTSGSSPLCPTNLHHNHHLSLHWELNVIEIFLIPKNTSQCSLSSLSLPLSSLSSRLLRRNCLNRKKDYPHIINYTILFWNFWFIVACPFVATSKSLCLLLNQKGWIAVFFRP